MNAIGIVSDTRVVNRKIYPQRLEDIRPHPRVEVVGTDNTGFTRVRARLYDGEALCRKCGTPHHDPSYSIQTCPTCGGDFNG